MPFYLTTASQVMCPHGGQVTLFTSNAKTTAAGSPILLESDQHIVAGCAFTIGPKPSPCLRVTWSAGSVKTTSGAAPLTQSSIGICYSPEGAPQGVAIVVNTQTQVEAL
jgi:hypothetical protein